MCSKDTGSGRPLVILRQSLRLSIYVSCPILRSLYVKVRAIGLTSNALTCTSMSCAHNHCGTIESIAPFVLTPSYVFIFAMLHGHASCVHLLACLALDDCTLKHVLHRHNHIHVLAFACFGWCTNKIAIWTSLLMHEWWLLTHKLLKSLVSTCWMMTLLFIAQSFFTHLLSTLPSNTWHI